MVHYFKSIQLWPQSFYLCLFDPLTINCKCSCIRYLIEGKKENKNFLNLNVFTCNTYINVCIYAYVLMVWRLKVHLYQQTEKKLPPKDLEFDSKEMYNMVFTRLKA